jgi:hypothetical protein
MKNCLGDMFEIASLTGNARGDETFPDMAINAVDACVRGGQVRGVHRRHGVASLPAKFRRIGVFPTINIPIQVL